MSDFFTLSKFQLKNEKIYFQKVSISREMSKQINMISKKRLKFQTKKRFFDIQ